MSSVSISLSMIVKDEVHVIARCLESVLPLIDYWIVCDTGSTDGTQEAIRHFFSRHGKPGELHERPWRDFAHNRTEALALARPHCDYTLVIDADDTLEIPSGYELPALTADSYLLNIQDTNIRYQRAQLFRNSIPWRYRGILHEFPDGAGARTSSCLPIIIRRNHDGARRRDPETYRKDAAILERELLTESDPFMRSRYTFYLAQSYRDCGERQKALYNYLARAGLRYWQEEVFCALYQAARLKAALAYPDQEVIAAYLQATDAQPTRAEALHAASQFCRDKRLHEQGYQLAKRGMTLPPPADGLFVEPWVYAYGLIDELSVHAYWIGQYAECVDLCDRLLTAGNMPEAMRGRVQKNRAFAVERLSAAGDSSSEESDEFTGLLKLARRKEEIGLPIDQVLAAFDAAIAANPQRAEALHGAARFCRDKGLHAKAYTYAHRGLAIARPTSSPPEADWIYDYGLLDELSVAAYWTERYQESLNACLRLLNIEDLADGMRSRVRNNARFSHIKSIAASLIHRMENDKYRVSDIDTYLYSNGHHASSSCAVQQCDIKDHRIIRTMHVVWVGDEARRPDNCIDTWRTMNPNWRVRVWGNDDLCTLRWRNLPRMREMLARELCGVADLMRWEILERHGGFAIDADSVCVRRLEDWLFEPELFACWENETARPGLVANGFVYSHPGSELIRQIIADLSDLHSLEDGLAWQLTGPKRLTDTIRKMKYQNITIYPSHYFLPEHLTGVRYSGSGPIFAEQFWGGANSELYDNLSARTVDDLVSNSRGGLRPR